MPACLNTNHCSLHCRPAVKSLAEFPIDAPSSGCLRIGLINNMPDSALEATERQFLSLLDSASGDIPVHLSLYALPGVPRKESGRRDIKGLYSSVEALWDKQLDGLIVTGAEPVQQNLKDEPYWESFTRVVEWARENTYSTVWSCLAAHAAVLHMDGVGRRRNREKHCGIFECERVCDHRLTAGIRSTIKIPHSRWNDISEHDLMACGYNVLTRTAGAGVDAFVKQEESLFVFFQGHPEYESDTLLYEYRRDVGRYLRGETGSYPLMPRSYFDRGTAKTLDDLRDKALSHRNEELLIEVQIALRRTERKNTWQPTAASIYRNWLQYIRTRKEGNVCLSNVGLPAEARNSVSRSRFELRPFPKHRLEESKQVSIWKELLQWPLYSPFPTKPK